MFEFRLMIDVVKHFLAHGENVVADSVTKLYFDMIAFNILNTMFG